MTVTLRHPVIARATGRGVRIAVVDSGVHADHPHVGRVAVVGGVGIDPSLGEHADYVDRLGHGTAVTAAILEKAPDAAVLAVKVFDRRLATSVDVLARGVEWAVEQGARIVNLSLGTTTGSRIERLAAALARAHAAGVSIVSAREGRGQPNPAGDLTGVLTVGVDWACPRDAIHIAPVAGGTPRLAASGHPRPIPGVAPERNLHGVSFAVANVTGFLARAVEVDPERRPETVLAALRDDTPATVG